MLEEVEEVAKILEEQRHKVEEQVELDLLVLVHQEQLTQAEEEVEQQ
jgi:hypothetical protein